MAKPIANIEVRTMKVADIVGSGMVSAEAMNLARITVYGITGAHEDIYVHAGAIVPVIVTGTRMIICGHPCVFAENSGELTAKFFVRHARGRYGVTPQVGVFDGEYGEGVTLVCKRDLVDAEVIGEEFSDVNGNMPVVECHVGVNNAIHTAKLFTEISKRRALLKRKPTKGVAEARRHIKARDPKGGYARALAHAGEIELLALKYVCKGWTVPTHKNSKLCRKFKDFLTDVKEIRTFADVYSSSMRGKWVTVFAEDADETGIRTRYSVSYRFVSGEAAETATKLIGCGSGNNY